MPWHTLAPRSLGSYFPGEGHCVSYSLNMPDVGTASDLAKDRDSDLVAERIHHYYEFNIKSDEMLGQLG